MMTWVTQGCLQPQNDSGSNIHFFRAIENGDLESAKKCLNVNINDFNKEKYWSGFTALHIVTGDPHSSNRSRDPEICIYLLSEGADVNIIETKDQRSPLHNAARFHRSDICEILINAGAHLDIQDNRGWTPLHWAAWAADRHPSVTVFEVLIKGGANMNVTENWYQRTALHWAAQYGRADICGLLLTAGANPNIEDATGRYPLNYAVEKNFVDVIKLLIDAGADVNKEGEWGVTPLHLAAKEGRRDICEMLVKAGASVLSVTKHNMTPLLLAKLWTNKEVIEYLEKVEGDVSSVISTFKRASAEKEEGDDDEEGGVDEEDDEAEEEEED